MSAAARARGGAEPRVRVAEPSMRRMAEATEGGPATSARGFDLHGLAAIAVADASASELAVVGRYLGLADAAFTDDAFLVLRGRHKSRVRVAVPLHRIGTGCEIVCERGLSAV